jgi:hypothetical protein
MSHSIESAFAYHAPKDGQPRHYEALRAKAREFALLAQSECPDSWEKTLALTRIDEAVMWANASIARNE